MNSEESPSTRRFESPGSRRRKGSTWRAALLTLGLLLAAHGAHAADLCFQDQIGDTLVFPKFRTPRPGACQPLSGYQHHSLITLTGTVCGTTDGTRLIFNFQYISTATALGPYHFAIGRSDDVAAAHACDMDSGGGAWGCANFLVRRIACPTPKLID